MALLISRSRCNRRRPSAYRANVEGLEQRVVLNGDPYGNLAQEIAGVVGNYARDYSPPWMDVYNWIGSGMPWDGLRPYTPPDRNDSGTYTIGGVTYNWTSTSTATSAEDGTPGGDSSGRTDWSANATLTSIYTLSGNGGDGTTSTVVDQQSSYEISWAAWGDLDYVNFTVSVTSTSSNSHTVTGDAEPGDRTTTENTAEYTLDASGGESGGVSTGTYTFWGKTTDRTEIHDDGGEGGFSHSIDAMEYIEYEVNDQGGVGPGVTGTYEEINSGNSSFTGLAWGSDSYGGGYGDGGYGEGPHTTVTDDNVRLTTWYDDHHRYRIWGTRGPTGSTTNQELVAGGTDGFNLIAWAGPVDAGQPALAFGGPQEPPPGGTTLVTADQSTAWDVGWEWLTGSGPQVRNFTGRSQFTQDLARHEGIQDARDAAVAMLNAGTANEGETYTFGYSLAGVQGVFLYIRDYSVIATGGTFGGNLSATFLGSYGGKYTLTNIDDEAGTATITFHVTNNSSLESATRFPVVGYMKSSPLRSILGSKDTGWGRTITQNFDWSGPISFTPRPNQ